MIDIKQLQRETKKYEFADGVRDMQMALLLLLIGAMTWVVWDLPTLWLPPIMALIEWQGRLFAGLVVFGGILAAFVIVAGGGLKLMNEFLRRRWLWRNTGVVNPARWALPRSILFLSYGVAMVVLLAGFGVAAIMQEPWWIVRMLYVGIGLSQASLYLALGWHLDISRYRVLGIVGAVGTLGLVLLPLAVGAVGGLICLFWAVILVASGVIGFREVAAQQLSVQDAT